MTDSPREILRNTNPHHRISFKAPSVESARSHFRSNLPHRIPDSNQKSGFRLASPGETVDRISGAAAEMYDVWKSPLSSMDEFGIGVSLYFHTLMGLFVIVVICGCVSLPAMKANADFNGDVNISLKGSAVNANREDFDTPQGLCDLLVMIILLLFILSSGRAMDKLVDAIDKSQQTAQDYAVVVRNPHPDATDPEEWKEFFQSEFGEVVYVTVALNNGPLLQALGKKRLLESSIDHLSRPVEGNPVDESVTTGFKAVFQPLGFFRNLAWYREQLKQVEIRVAQLAKPSKPYGARKVFVLFETEFSQRNCMHTLGGGFMRNLGSSWRSETRMRGRRVRVKEPVEPSEVLWQNLHVGQFTRMRQQMQSYVLCAGILYGSWNVLKALNDSGTASAIFVAMLNASLPAILKNISQALEQHVDEGNLNSSIMHKLLLCRMINSAFLIYTLTPFDESLQEKHIQKIQNVLLADCFATPFFRFFNPFVFLNQVILAKTARSQDKLNFFYRGAYWNLAERYTDMLKTLFVSLFYSPILPTGLFITALSFVTTYWVDKYCLFRMWQRPPMLDDTLGVVSRSYMYFIVFFHANMASRFFAGWPFQSNAEKPDCNLIRCKADDTFMSDVQVDWVRVNEGFAITMLVLVLLRLFSAPMLWFYHKCCGAGDEHHGGANPTNFRDVSHIHTYAPMVRVFGLNHSLLACDYQSFPRLNLPFDRSADPERYNLVSEHDLPTISQEERRALFSRVKFFPRSDDNRAATQSVSSASSPKSAVGKTMQAQANQAYQPAAHGAHAPPPGQGIAMQHPQQQQHSPQPQHYQMQAPYQQQQQPQLQYSPQHSPRSQMQQQPYQQQQQPVGGRQVRCGACQAVIVAPPGMPRVQCGNCRAVIDVSGL